MGDQMYRLEVDYNPFEPEISYANNSNDDSFITVEKKIRTKKKSLGDKALQRNDFHEAIACYSEEIGRDSSNTSLLIKRATCLMNLRRFDLAAKDIQQAIAVEPQDSSFHHRLVDCFLRMGDVKSAEKAVAETRKKFAKFSKLLTFKVEKIERLKRYINNKFKASREENEIFLKLLNQILKATPECPDYKFLKMRTLVILGRVDEIDDSLNESKTLEAMSAYYDGNVETSAQLMENLRRQREFPQAIKNFYEENRELLNLKEAGKLSEQMEFGKALKILDHIQQVDPSNLAISTEIFLMKATINLDLKRIAQALECISQALAIKPKLDRAIVIQAKCFMKQEIFEQALSLCDEILNCSQSSFTKDLAQEIKNEALEAQKLSQEQVNSQLAPVQSNVDANTTLNLNQKPPQTSLKGASSLLSLASTNKYSGIKHAIAHSTEVINSDPRNPNSYIDRASWYIVHSEIEMATRDAQTAAAYSSGAWKKPEKAIKCFIMLGMRSDAKRLNEIVKNEKFKALIATLEGFDSKIRALFDNKNYGECLSYVEKAQNWSRACVEYRNLRVRCLIKLNRLDEAERLIAEVLSKNPNHADMIYFQALSYYRLGEFPYVMAHLKDCLRINPSQTEALQLRDRVLLIEQLFKQGMLSFKSNDHKSSIQFFIKVYQAYHPENKYRQLLFYNIGSSHLILNEFEKAIIYFTEVLRLDKSHVKSLTKRAEAFFKAEAFEQCEADCDAVLRLEPSHIIQNLKSELRKKQLQARS